MADFPILQTKRLVLRSFEASDAPAVFAIFAREAVTRYLNQERMQAVGDAQDLVARRTGLWVAGLGARWAIALKEQPGTVIGSCGYDNINRAAWSIEIGYDLHPTYWRKGMMTEALTAMLTYCFGDRFSFRLNRVEALTYVAHIATIGLLRKLGFQEEGVRREALFARGQFHDVRGFSLLRRDWEYQRLTRERGVQQPDFTPDEHSTRQGDANSRSSQGSRLRGWIV
jgi:ribosomal-protein-alanine N-acetyltransferase